MLNVFLAIAVDNLANAQELTAAEEADEKANEIFDDSESIEDQYVLDNHCNINLEEEDIKCDSIGKIYYL